MSRRRRRRGSSDAGKWALGAALFAMSISIVGAFAYFRATTPDPVKVDTATLCPEAGPSSITVILLDASDEWPEITKSDALNVMRDVAASVAKHELLEFRVLDPMHVGGRKLFAKCNPGDGSELSQMVANPEIARRRWETEFQKPLSAVLQQLETSPADSSPIAATLQNIAVDLFGRSVVAAIPKRVVIVSDMIEHSEVYSQYRDSLSYEDFRKTNAYKRLRTDLREAVVDIFYVQRLKPKMDSGAHIEFWEAWIQDNHGRRGRARKLQGAG